MSIHLMVMYGSYRYLCSQVTLCIIWSLLCNQRRVLQQDQIKSLPEKHEAPFNTQLGPRMSPPSPAKVVAHLMLFTTKSLGLPDMVKRTTAALMQIQLSPYLNCGDSCTVAALPFM